MKIIKKIAAIMLSVMMVLGMCSVVGAEGTTTSGTSAANTGSIKINNAIKDQTYTIYQILELESFSEKPTTGETDAGNYAYKATDKWRKFVSEAANTSGKKYFIEEGGYVKWNPEVGKEAGDIEEFAKKALAYAKDVNNKVANKGSTTAEGTTVTFDNLSLGYYLVDSSTGALCSLDTTAMDVTINEKNKEPKLNKQVKEDSTSDWKNENTADIGQKVEFQVTIDAKKGAENYVLHDVMSNGLTFDPNSVIVVKKTGDNNQTLTKGTDYQVVTTGLEDTNPCTFHVEFVQTFCDTLTDDDKLIVTYSATLNNKDAVVAGSGNSNIAKLEYGDKHFTTPSETTTKTYEIPVLKYTNKNGRDTPLAGAVFELYRDKECKTENQVSFVKNATDLEKYDLYRIATSSDVESESVKQITTTTEGKFKIYGLDADTYYLKEVTPPAGYNKLTSPIEIKIDTDGKIYVNKSTVANSGAVKVENKTGSILPSTGGMGTTLFYIFGVILVVGSGVVLITKKRMK